MSEDCLPFGNFKMGGVHIICSWLLKNQPSSKTAGYYDSYCAKTSRRESDPSLYITKAQVEAPDSCTNTHTHTHTQSGCCSHHCDWPNSASRASSSRWSIINPPFASRDLALRSRGEPFPAPLKCRRSSVTLLLSVELHVYLSLPLSLSLFHHSASVKLQQLKSRRKFAVFFEVPLETKNHLVCSLFALFHLAEASSKVIYKCANHIHKRLNKLIMLAVLHYTMSETYHSKTEANNNKGPRYYHVFGYVTS